jgi:hypothetical protein
MEGKMFEGMHGDDADHDCPGEAMIDKPLNAYMLHPG